MLPQGERVVEHVVHRGDPVEQLLPLVTALAAARPKAQLVGGAVEECVCVGGADRSRAECEAAAFRPGAPCTATAPRRTRGGEGGLGGGKRSSIAEISVFGFWRKSPLFFFFF